MRSILLAIMMLAFARPALAQSSVLTDHAESTLVADSRGVSPGGVATLAFAQKLEPGWHVYWMNPGDSGLPLEFVWTLPSGAVAGDISYPSPHRIAIGPLVNFGHEGEPVFLTSVTAPSDAPLGSSLSIKLDATWLICADVCVPETGSFALSIPVVADPQPDPAVSAIFEAGRSALPAPLDGEANFSADDVSLTLDLPDDPAAEEAYFFPAMAGVSEPAAAQKFRRKDGRLTLAVKGGAELKNLGDRLAGVVEYSAGGEKHHFAFDAERRGAAASGGGVNAGGRGLFGFLLAAFAGGAILNLMPCVFPILFVKAASMANAAHERPSIMRRHGLLYALGVIATFAALGGSLIGLRAAGEGLGWGFHLQSPTVVALSAYVLFAVGLNLAGAFHVGSSLQNMGAGLLSGRGGDATAFLTGALAVIVAAPCVGPLLTAPVGAAVTLPAISGLAIFIAMGAGLAAPYVALSFWPGARRILPKPGPWMERFRQALSFPVFAAAAYFIWVLSIQTGGRGLALTLAGVIFVALAARIWEWGRNARWGAIGAVIALAAALVPVALLRPAAAAASASEAVAFDPADIARRRAAGERIFVDFTAAWCVTCQVNKLTVLADGDVKKAFADRGVTVVMADWTNKDPVIAAALASFGANGVPLYVYYGSGEEPTVLPQALSARMLIDAVTAADEGDQS